MEVDQGLLSYITGIIEDILKSGSQGHVHSTTNISACTILCLRVSSSSWIRDSSDSEQVIIKGGIGIHGVHEKLRIG